MTKLGRTGTLAVISALSEIGDAMETLDRLAGGPAWRTTCHGFQQTSETDDAMLDVNMALERALLRMVDVLRDGVQV